MRTNETPSLIETFFTAELGCYVVGVVAELNIKFGFRWIVRLAEKPIPQTQRRVFPVKTPISVCVCQNTTSLPY